jgi:hypothetical protein
MTSGVVCVSSASRKVRVLEGLEGWKVWENGCVCVCVCVYVLRDANVNAVESRGLDAA